jgi:ATP-binding cassette subfamily F protein uup
MALLTLTEVAKTYDANRPLLRDVSLVVRDGDRIGLIGANGSGKSTLLRIAAGEETMESGERVVRQGARIVTLEQEPHFDPESTVREAVHAGLAGRVELLAELEQVHAKLSAKELDKADLKRLLRRQEHLQHELDELGGHDVEHLVEATVQRVGLPDPDALCGTLSGGEARRVALARVLVRPPDLLFLDEPTNHLDAFVIAWLEAQLEELKVPFVIITHDRYLLDRVVDRIVEIDRGHSYEYEGGYSEYVIARAARLEAEERTERSRLNVLRRETQWMRRGPPARTTKSKARIARYNDLVSSAPDAALEELSLAFPFARRLGTKVLELNGVSHSYDGRVVLPEVDLRLEPGTRLGVVGPNGAGKSTLVKILLGALAPTAGDVVVGSTVRYGTVDQRREDLDPDRTVVQEVAGKGDHVMVGDRRIHVASFLDRFLFPGPKKDVLIGSLSGGERGRVLLAKLLLTGANVLVLDEPTNDLDLSTMRALEEALIAFHGAAVVVSHDRWFLDRVATEVLHLDGQGGAYLHAGDMTSLLERLPDRGKGSTAATKKSKSTPGSTKPAASAASGKKRLAPWEKRELDELTVKISELEEAVGKIDAELADPDVYGAGGDQGRALQDRRASSATQLDAALARWEELAERDE